MYKLLINQITEKCLIKNEEEREINRFFLKETPSKTKFSDKSLLNYRPKQ